MSSANRLKPATAAKSVPMETLKGVFAVPKMNHRRDFLRENKLNLQQLQRITCKKKQGQQNEQEIRQQRHQRQQQNQQQLNVGRRSASQQRPVARQQTLPQLQQQQQHPRAAQKQRSFSQQRCMGQSQPPLGSARHRNQQHGSYEMQQPTTTTTKAPKLGSALKSSVSMGTLCSTSSKMSCDKEIQTEDIQDEVYLYNALKKCSSDFRTKPNSSQQSINNNNNNTAPAHDSLNNGYGDDDVDDYMQQRHTHFGEGQRQRHDAATAAETYGDGDGELYLPPPSTTRSHTSIINNCNGKDQHQQQHLHENMEQLSLGNNASGMQRFQQQQLNEQQQPLSGRSRRTICSTKSHDSIISKKTSTSSLLKLGARDDIRLPRYLEREKREREEQRQRNMERDPHCPVGHYPLSEDERMTTLNAAEKKFRKLVEELNRMPMTSETLRIRARKVEIEKELAALEADIRVYSKPKVYIKQMD